jgi:glutamine synthetase
MTVLRNHGQKARLSCLLHEKPFAGVNGSGKHVNWSIGNATQGNLLDPGKTPHDNLQFLLFCGAVIRGVHVWALLRAVIATASNDHRLGANEAPPAIISVYLGSQLEDVFTRFVGPSPGFGQRRARWSWGSTPCRNSPRMPWRSQPHLPLCLHRQPLRVPGRGLGPVGGGPLVAMNTILADSLSGSPTSWRPSWGPGLNSTSPSTTSCGTSSATTGVVFNGNGYSTSGTKWPSTSGGWLNLRTTADALPVLREQYIEDLFANAKVLSPVELGSRFEAYSEQYIQHIEVEAKLVISMAKTIIYPAAMRYLGELAKTIDELKDIGIEFGKDSAVKVAELTKGDDGQGGQPGGHDDQALHVPGRAHAVLRPNPASPDGRGAGVCRRPRG